MRILLVGEYSGLHNSLKEGLTKSGHEVVIVGNGDGFKKFPVDFLIDARWSQTKLLNIPRQILFRLFKYDFARLEYGLRFYFLLPKFKNFDIVQLINEAPIKTEPWFELFLLKKLRSQNGKFYLLSCGADYLSVKYAFEKKLRYSFLNPYFENPKLEKYYRYIFNYLKPAHRKLHEFVYDHCNAVLASDIDYVLPLEHHPKFAGLVPNPINLTKLVYTPIPPMDKIVIFLGINRWNYIQKGIRYFEEALEIIRHKYADKVSVIVSENVPYTDYVNSYNACHILLDQVYSYDQGYNALEAMARGKVVFTGAETEFYDYYNLDTKVAINALPDVKAIVAELSFLIENPDEILTIGESARNFVSREHDYRRIAEKYLRIWTHIKFNRKSPVIKK